MNNCRLQVSDKLVADRCGTKPPNIATSPGYHQQGALSKEDGQYHELPIDCVKEDDAVFLEMMPGDVAIFGGFVPHRSATNLSDTWRRQLFISYNKLSDGGDQYKSHYQEFHQWLRKRYAEHNKFDVYFK